MKKLTISLCGLIALAAMIPAAQAEESEAPTGKLMVVWTSGDPDVAEKVCLMYTHAAKTRGWFDEVLLVVWGPSAELLSRDEPLQTKVRQMMDAGVRAEADIRNEKINYKIREHSVSKVPVILAIGQREVADRTVTMRRLGEKSTSTLGLAVVIESLSAEATPPDLK